MAQPDVWLHRAQGGPTRPRSRSMIRSGASWG